MSDDSSPDKAEAEDFAIDEEDHTTESPESEVIKSHLQSGELNFNFIAYDEKIVIVGASGSGKTYLANQIMRGTQWNYCLGI